MRVKFLSMKQLAALKTATFPWSFSILSSKIGDGQNTDPQSMDYLNGLPKSNYPKMDYT